MYDCLVANCNKSSKSISKYLFHLKNDHHILGHFKFPIHCSICNSSKKYFDFTSFQRHLKNVHFSEQSELSNIQSSINMPASPRNTNLIFSATSNSNYFDEISNENNNQLNDDNNLYLHYNDEMLVDSLKKIFSFILKNEIKARIK